MQEQVERESLAITVNATKLTGRVLAKACMMVVKKVQQEYKDSQTPRGKQSVKKLMNHNADTDTVPLNGDTKLFDRIAREHNVDYAFRKIGPEKYLLFFKTGQSGAITSCLSKYANQVMTRGTGRPSILAQLKKYVELVKARGREPHQRERGREAARHER